MLISIIIPVYNTQKYLARCIHSLLQQTYTNIEILLIDDGSTDNSYSLCQEFAVQDSRIVLYHQKNQGVSAARNKGISLASGDFIMFVDSDDYVDPTICQSLIDGLNNSEYTDTQTVFCGYHFVHSKNEHVVKTENVVPSSTSIWNLEDFKKNYGPMLNSKILLSLWAKLFSAKVIKMQHLHFHEDLHIGEDLTFLQDYLLALPTINIAIVQKPLYYYDVKEGSSLSSSFDFSRLEGSRHLYQSMLDFCNHMGIFQNGAPYASLYYFRSCSVFINQLMQHSDQLQFIQTILAFPETKQALKLVSATSAEGLYYTIAFRMPPLLLKQFIKLRQWIIRKLRRI